MVTTRGVNDDYVLLVYLYGNVQEKLVACTLNWRITSDNKKDIPLYTREYKKYTYTSENQYRTS